MDNDDILNDLLDNLKVNTHLYCYSNIILGESFFVPRVLHFSAICYNNYFGCFVDHLCRTSCSI